MRKFSYKGFSRIKIAVSQFFGVLGLLFFTSFTLFSIIAGLSYVSNTSNSFLDDPRMTLFCFMTVFLLITWTLCSTLINYLPTVWLDKNGLIISAYILLHIRIPWSNI